MLNYITKSCDHYTKKSKVLDRYLWEPHKTSKVKKGCLKCVQNISDKKGKCLNILLYCQKVHKPKVCAVKQYMRQGQMYC